MKRYFILISLLIASLGMQAQLDRSIPPKPGDAPKLELGKYETFTLDNGLTVILVENHKLPRVSISLQLDYDPIKEGDQAGMASMAGSLLRTGTENRTKQEIDEAVDFIGATLNTSAGGMYGACLTKHLESLMDLFTDVLYHPVFPVEEFEKAQKQTLSALSMSSSDANTMASMVSAALVYGNDHPYGEPMTEKTVENITLDGIRTFYETYYKPSVAYLILVGDMTLPETRTFAQKYFGSWAPGNVPSHTYPDPDPIDGVRVAFVDKPGAVQSVINITHPVYLKPGTPDAIPAQLMNTILGGGVFSGRLMMNLREDKAYTYGATSGLSADRLVGRFQAGAQVGNAVTDSAVTEFFYEIKRMIGESVSAEDLQLNKNVIAGQFARSLENPQTIASFALNTIRYELPSDYYTTYLERLQEVTIQDIQDMAERYLNPDQCYVVVVGNKSEVAEKLTRFATRGEVEYYDQYGNPVEQVDAADLGGVTASSVVDRFIAVSGGKEAMAGIKQITQKAKGVASAMGQEVEISMTTIQKAPNLVSLAMEMNGMLLSKQVFDGEKGFIASMQGEQDVTGEDLEKLKYASYMFPELFYEELGYQLELVGKESIEGEEVYVIRVTTPAGSVQSEYFSLESGLKRRIVSVQETPQGSLETIIDYMEYKEVDGVMFPWLISQQAGPQKIGIEVLEIDTQSEIDPSVFKK